MILVTGGTGFLGAYVIADLLRSGKKVRATRRESSNMEEVNRILQHRMNSIEVTAGNLEWVEGDLLDTEALFKAMEGVDEVYHSAAVVSFLARDRKMMMQANVEGTANVVNAALAAGVKKFCHVSSIAALGRSRHSDHIDEESKWEDSKINSNYAISKFRAELEVWRGIEEGLNAVIVNPGVILGYCDWNKGTGKIFRRVFRGNPFYTNGVSGYVDVRDISAAMIQLMDRNIFGKRFVLVSENTDWKTLLTEIAEGFGRKPPTVHLPRWMVEIGWRMLYVFSLMSTEDPLVTRETARSAYNRFYYSSERIKKELSFNFTPVKKTVIRSCSEFLQNQIK